MPKIPHSHRWFSKVFPCACQLDQLLYKVLLHPVVVSRDTGPLKVRAVAAVIFLIMHISVDSVVVVFVALCQSSASRVFGVVSPCASSPMTEPETGDEIDSRADRRRN